MGCFSLLTLDTLIKGGQLQGDQTLACVLCPVVSIPQDYARLGRPLPCVKPKADRLPCSPITKKVLTWEGFKEWVPMEPVRICLRVVGVGQLGWVLAIPPMFFWRWEYITGGSDYEADVT